MKVTAAHLKVKRGDGAGAIGRSTPAVTRADYRKAARTQIERGVSGIPVQPSGASSPSVAAGLDGRVRGSETNDGS